jgi:hypothetical protein
MLIVEWHPYLCDISTKQYTSYIECSMKLLCACVCARTRFQRAEERTEELDNLKVGTTSLAECTEVEYATERYSGSPPPADSKTNKGDQS